MISVFPATDWPHHVPADDPQFNSCSPNLQALRTEMEHLWGLKDLGCYGERNIRGGTLPSAHSHGAAVDLRYLEQIGRTRFVNEVLPWLIANSLELHVQSIHDYLASSIWHAGRTQNVMDAYAAWWMPQTPNPSTGMGQSWAGWVHIETSIVGWHDATPITKRFTTFPPTTPPPPPPEDDMAKPIFIGVEGSPGQYLWFGGGTTPIAFTDTHQRDLLLAAYALDPNKGTTISPEMFARLV